MVKRSVKKATEVRRVEQKPYENIYKEFVIQVARNSYHNINVLYNDMSGTYYSTGEKYQDIEKYLLKYMKIGAINTAGVKPKAYLRKWEKMINKKHEEDKVWLIYIDNTKQYKGQNMLYRVGVEELRKKRDCVREILIENGFIEENPLKILLKMLIQKNK